MELIVVVIGMVGKEARALLVIPAPLLLFLLPLAEHLFLEPLLLSPDLRLCLALRSQ